MDDGRGTYSTAISLTPREIVESAGKMQIVAKYRCVGQGERSIELEDYQPLTASSDAPSIMMSGT